MADIIEHARAYSPYFIPNKGGSPNDMHGLTKATFSSSTNSTDEFVIGLEDKCGTDKGIPEATFTATQFEKGDIASWLTLANLASEPSGGLTLSDFSSALVDIVGYRRDEFDGNIVSTIWFPKTAMTSLGIDIASFDAKVERSFDFKGDNKFTLNNDNAVLVHVKDTGATTGSYTIDVTASGSPVIDPNNSGAYILRIDRTRSGETETLDTTDFTYNSGNDQITVTAVTGDVYNIYYSVGAFPSGGDPTTVPDEDPCFIKADSVTVLISDTINEVELEYLTSASIKATLNRLDEGVIGNTEKILKEISDTPVDVSLSGRVKNNEILDAFMNHLAVDHTPWGITDMNKYLDNVRVTIKIYSDSTKSTFLIGYQVSGLSFKSDSEDITANEFSTMSVDASATNLTITTVEANLT